MKKQWVPILILVWLVLLTVCMVLFQMRTGMVCSPVPALMIWQVPPVRNSPRQFFEKRRKSGVTSPRCAPRPTTPP